MKPVLYATRQFFRELWHDVMMAALLVAPLLMGLIFRFGFPALEKQLCAIFDCTALLAPYYPLCDLMLGFMTPVFFCFAGAMGMLSEMDNGVARALCVTPLGKRGYLLSRIGVPAALGFVVTICALWMFHLTPLRTSLLLAFSLVCTVQGAAAALMVVSFAQNKVEGLALSKLCGIPLCIGIPVALLVTHPVQYIVAPLPCFWLTDAMLTGNLLFLLPALVTSLAWSALFYRRYLRRLQAG